MCESRFSVHFSCKSTCNFLCSAGSLFVAEIRKWDVGIKEKSPILNMVGAAQRSVTAIIVHKQKCSTYKTSVERRGFGFVYRL